MDIISLSSLDGYRYLGVYAASLAIAMAVAWLVRGHLRQPGGRDEAITLDAEQAAFLADGPKRALHVALASLLDSKALTVVPSELGHPAIGAGPVVPGHPTALERALLAEVQEGSVSLDPEGFQAIQARLPELRVLGEELTEMDLLLSPEAAGRVRLWPALIMAAVVPLGVARLVRGIAWDRPVGFLAFMVGVAIFAATNFAARGAHRTRRGDDALNRWCVGVQGLRSDNSTTAMKVALTGAAALAAFGLVFPDPATAGRSGTGADGGCGDGGCGGGGCGGCGGCGG